MTVYASGKVATFDADVARSVKDQPEELKGRDASSLSVMRATIVALQKGETFSVYAKDHELAERVGLVVGAEPKG
jgi:hypothetical protein